MTFRRVLILAVLVLSGVLSGVPSGVLPGVARAAPSSPIDSLIETGSQKLEAGDLPGALERFDRAARQPGEVEPVIQRSIALRQCKKPEEAAKAAREAVKIAPQHAMAQVNLGTTLEAIGRVDEARAAFTTATKIKSDYALAFWSLG